MREPTAEQALRDLQRAVLNWCDERTYTPEEFAILRRIRDELVERIAQLRTANL